MTIFTKKGHLSLLNGQIYVKRVFLLYIRCTWIFSSLFLLSVIHCQRVAVCPILPLIGGWFWENTALRNHFSFLLYLYVFAEINFGYFTYVPFVLFSLISLPVCTQTHAFHLCCCSLPRLPWSFQEWPKCFAGVTYFCSVKFSSVQFLYPSHLPSWSDRP